MTVVTRLQALNSLGAGERDSALQGMNLNRLSNAAFESCMVQKMATSSFQIPWRHRSLSNDVDLARQAVRIVPSYLQAMPCDAELRTAFSDRYGGLGVGVNGGSARSGLVEGLHVKGIGITALCGDSAKYGNAAGNLSIVETVREAIWSQVYEALLPWGAVTTLGIVTYADESPKTSASDFTPAMNGLAIREPVVRPAHLMRARQFSRSLDRIAADVNRTCSNIDSIASEIAAQSHLGCMTLNHEDVLTWLRQMLKRWAEQIAAATFLRIPHGSLNCSNIEISGRYIDFGTATSLPDFLPIIVAKGNPRFGACWTFVLRSVNELCYSFNRFHLQGRSISTQEELALVGEFSLTYKKCLESGMLRLLGFDAHMRDLLPDSLRKGLAAELIKLTTTSAEAAFALHKDISFDSVRAIPKYLRLLACCETKDALIASGKSEAMDVERTAVLTELTAKYFEARQILEGAGVDIGQFRYDCWALNQDRETLYKPRLDEEIRLSVEGFLKEPLAIREFIEKRVLDAVGPLIGVSVHDSARIVGDAQVGRRHRAAWSIECAEHMHA